MNEIALMKNNLEKRKSNYIIRNFLNILIEKKMMMIDKENRLNKSLKYKIAASSEKLTMTKKLLSKIKLEDKIKEKKEYHGVDKDDQDITWESLKIINELKPSIFSELAGFKNKNHIIHLVNTD